MCYFPGSSPGNAQLRRLRSSQSRAAYHSSNISATKVSPSIISCNSKNTARGICLKTGSRDLSSSTEIRFCPGHGKKGSNYLKSPLIWYVFLCTSQASLTVRIIFPRYEIENGLSEGVFLCTQNAFAALWVCFWTQYLIKMHSLTPNADQWYASIHLRSRLL